MNHHHHTNAVVRSADEVASAALDQAMNAAGQGTFAVGGCLIENATGRIIKAMHNNVLKPLHDTHRIFTYDPTAHGERQLVYWYYANQKALNLPEPHKLTIVTSLDPCAMCAGTLLATGFNVGVVAMDTFAGINYDQQFTFNSLPPGLRTVAQSKFGYYACGHEGRDPAIYLRKYIGGADVVFHHTTVASQRLMGCGSIFEATADTVRYNSSHSGLPPAELRDPAELPDNSPLKTSYRKIYPDAFKVKVPHSRLPNAGIHDLLKQTREAEPGAENAVALLDPFGNVILCLPDTFAQSPVHTAFMNVTRAYATTRFELMNNEATRREATRYLTQPKYGTFVFLHAPTPGDATTVMTLGAYGSTMEGGVPRIFPSNFQYFHPPLRGTTAELSAMIMDLPPLYTQLIQISPMKTAFAPQ